jgi:hypothetical protein
VVCVVVWWWWSEVCVGGVFPITAIFSLANKTSPSQTLIFRNNVAEDIGHMFILVFTSMPGIFTFKLMEQIGKFTMINLLEGPK